MTKIKAFLELYSVEQITLHWTDKTLKQKEFRTIEATLKTNGYPRKLFNRRLMQKKQMENNEKPKITTSLPYVQEVTELIKRDATSNWCGGGSYEANFPSFI